MVEKPTHLFDRDSEWHGLTSFVANQSVGATLGVISGRRRQGKSYLLEALTAATDGIYFPALEATEAISLREFSATLVRHGIPIRRPLQDWTDAISLLFSSIQGQPRVVVLDEFPFLVRTSPHLPSIIQRELGPGGSGRSSTARLLLCGSAMSVMGKLLAGQAPLRGRAGLEMLVRPFGYKDAASFWGLSDRQLAVLVDAVVGGTPAYRREFVGSDTPAGLDDFDDWILRTALNPQTPLFREARYLLAEETEIRDVSLYQSVLAAIATGNRTYGGIANYVGRKSPEIAHPLNVLEDAALITRDEDAFRQGRRTYRINEPLISFYQAVMWPDFARLEAGQAQAVWRDQQPTFLKQVVGPHFENLCRQFAVSSVAAEDYAEPVGDVRSGVINDPSAKEQIEIDVVVFGRHQPNESRRILSLGEAKWSEPMGHSHVARLARARDLLAAKGFDVRDTKLTCYAGGGFKDSLRADDSGTISLVGLDRLYAR
jgi:hypothetical protein